MPLVCMPYTFPAIFVPGATKYYVAGWVDENGDDIKNAGDYFGFHPNGPVPGSPNVTVRANETTENVDIVLGTEWARCIRARGWKVA